MVKGLSWARSNYTPDDVPDKDATCNLSCELGHQLRLGERQDLSFSITCFYFISTKGKTIPVMLVVVGNRKQASSKVLEKAVILVQVV